MPLSKNGKTEEHVRKITLSFNCDQQGREDFKALVANLLQWYSAFVTNHYFSNVNGKPCGIIKIDQPESEDEPMPANAFADIIAAMALKSLINIQIETKTEHQYTN